MRRILVLAPNKPFLGAQIVQLPFLHELRSRNPESRLTLALPFSGVSLFEEFRFHDEIVHGWAESAGRTIAFLARSPLGRFDEVYSLRGRSTRAGLAALLSSARRRVGFDIPGNRPFFNERIAPREDVYLAVKYLDLLGEGRAFDRVPRVPLWTDEHALYVTRLLVERGIRPPMVGIVAGAGREKKRFPASQFVAAAERIRAAFPEITVIYFLSSAEISGDLGRALSGVPRQMKFVFESVRALACAIAKCTALLSSDCGPAHIGHLLGVPQLVLFDGTGRPHEWFRSRAGATYLIAKNSDPVSEIGLEPVCEAILGVIELSRL